MKTPQRDRTTRQLIQMVRRREERRRRRRIGTAIAVGVVVVCALAFLGVRSLIAEPGAPAVNAGTSTTAGIASSTTYAAVPAASPTSVQAETSTTTATTELPAPVTTSTEQLTTTTTAPALRPALAFDAGQAMEHVKMFAKEIGVRRGGTPAEAEAAGYALTFMTSLGYEAVLRDVPIPNGLTSHNVIAVKKGSSPLTLVIGGHMDSKSPAPGANDNASGSAAVLELARDFAAADTVPTVVFVLFGNEEMIDKDSNHHHYGSRAYVASMTTEERQNLAAMISLDMIGYGDTLTVRTMGKGPIQLRTQLQDLARRLGVSLKYVKDTGSSGMSDHEPFELAGYPAAWLEWREDPLYHTTRDVYEHVNAARLEKAGKLVASFISRLRLADLERLRAAVTAD